MAAMAARVARGKRQPPPEPPQPPASERGKHDHTEPVFGRLIVAVVNGGEQQIGRAKWKTIEAAVPKTLDPDGPVVVSAVHELSGVMYSSLHLDEPIYAYYRRRP